MPCSKKDFPNIHPTRLANLVAKKVLVPRKGFTDTTESCIADTKYIAKLFADKLLKSGLLDPNVRYLENGNIEIKIDLEYFYKHLKLLMER